MNSKAIIALIGAGGTAVTAGTTVTVLHANGVAKDKNSPNPNKGSPLAANPDPSPQDDSETIKWKFLYKFGEKVFERLKSDPNVNEDSNLLNWLKSELGGNWGTETDNWKRFKVLCEVQMPAEDSTSTSVKQEAVRLCYADENGKGNLYYWSKNNSAYDGFKDWPTAWTNKAILEDYLKGSNNKDPLTDFGSWYGQETLAVNSESKKLSEFLG